MTFLAGLQTIDIVILITLPCAFLIGIGIFFLAGLHHVKKNYVIIIERAKEYYATYEAGFHFKMPIAYQKVGTYCIAPITRGYTANNGNHLKITYQVIDPKKYHYSYIPFDALMKRIEKENAEITLDVLTNAFNNFGLKFISIDKFGD